jgi:hypothetical protein
MSTVELLGAFLILSVGILVIIAKEYIDLKKQYKELQEVYEAKRKKVCYSKTEHDECTMEKLARQLKIKYQEQEYQLKELDRMFKALLYSFNNYEVEISEDDMKAAERGNIYIEQAYLKFAKRVKLLFNENYFDTKKD